MGSYVGEYVRQEATSGLTVGTHTIYTYIQLSGVTSSPLRPKVPPRYDANISERQLILHIPLVSCSNSAYFNFKPTWYNSSRACRPSCSEVRVVW